MLKSKRIDLICIAVMALALISMGSALLYRRFLDREDPDQWDNL